MEVLLISPLTKRGEGAEVVEAAGVAKAMGVLVTPTSLLPPMEEGRRKMDFLAKSISPSLAGRKATPAKNGGKLPPQQMYEVVKRYETSVAHNKRLKGKGASLSTSQQRATGHTLGYRPRFHKTMAFATMMAESEDDGHYPQESSPHEGTDSFGAESSQEDDEGLFSDPVPEVATLQ